MDEKVVFFKHFADGAVETRILEAGCPLTQPKAYTGSICLHLAWCCRGYDIYFFF